jgi:outer membrane biosynthesis protein TonB
LPDISDVSPSALASTPEVDVIVTVDANGHVTHTQIQRRGRKPPRAIAAAAENAARQWVFEPAKLDDKAVVSEHSIVFQFGGH